MRLLPARASNTAQLLQQPFVLMRMHIMAHSAANREVCGMAWAGSATVQHRQRLAILSGSADGAAPDEAAAGQQRIADGSLQPAVVTNASLKLLAWLADYAALTG